MGRNVTFFRAWPALVVRHNLIWVRETGGTWAFWEIEPSSLDWWKVEDLITDGHRWAGGLASLENEWGLWGVCQHISSDAVRGDTVRGVNSPVWVNLADVTARRNRRPLWRRRLFLGVRLSGPWSQATVSYFAGLFQKTRRTAAAQPIPHTRQSSDDPTDLLTGREKNSYQNAVAALSGLNSRPAAAELLVWLSERMTDPLAQPDWETMSIADVETVEARNHLTVRGERSTTRQAIAVISGMPPRWEYPKEGMWLGRLDQGFGFPIDWVVRSMPRPNPEAIKKVRRSLRNMMSTAAELSDDPAGLPPDLREAHQGAAAAEEFLQSTGTPELRTVFSYRLWVDDTADGSADLLETRTKDLAQALQRVGIRTARPTGGQVALWKMHLPGSHVPRVGYDYHQWVTPHSVASGQPHNTYKVGDPGGVPLGYSGPNMVFVDPAYGPSINRPGAIGMVGEPGSGKSYTAKVLAAGQLWRGGRLVVLDRTTAGEWKDYIEAVTPDVTVLRLDSEADFDLNPLTLFDTADDRFAHALAMCMILTGVKARNDERTAQLIEGLQFIIKRRLPLDRLYRDSILGNEKLAATIRAFAYTRVGQQMFQNSDGKPVNTDAAAIVWWVPGLAPPKEGTPEGQLLVSHVEAMATAYLISALNRQSTFGERRRYGVNMYDEAWALTASAAGKQLLRDEARDGRKHNAGLWLASQDPADLGASAGAAGGGEARTLAAMIPTRLLFRLGDADTAQLGLEWLGAEVTSGRVEEVLALPTGTCLMRDLRGRIGQVRVAPPWMVGNIEEAINTNPTEIG